MRARFIFEKFTQDSDPVHDMGVGFDKKMTKTKAFKVLQFIAEKGEEGASLTEIQYFIWTKLKKYPKKDFWKNQLHGVQAVM